MNTLKELIGSDAGRTLKNLQRREKCENDFFKFCTTYLPHYFNKPNAEYQKILIDIANTNALTKENIEKLKPLIAEKYHTLLIETAKIKTVVDIEPRGFSKSTRWTFAYSLWRLLYKKNNFICVFCASQEKANEAIQNIKSEVENNELIFEDFGSITGKTWKEKFLTFSNGTAIKGFGADSAVRGARYNQYRPDLIICDDVLKDQNARTPAQRNKVYNWFLRAVLPLGQDIFTIIVNTVFHNDDLPSRLLKRIAAGELKNWIGLRFQAFKPDGSSLWQEYWTVEKLLEKKRELGSAAFSTEYMNEPISDEERIFKPEWFKRYDTVQVQELKIFMGVDPSAGKHDQFAIFTIGVAPDGFIYELDEWGETCSVEKATQTLIEKYLTWKPIRIGFESVGFQSIYKQYIIEAGARKGVYLPIKEIATRGIGKERILAISPLIENGILKFKSGHNRTIEQLVNFPKSDFDDLQDALFYAYEVSRKIEQEVFAFKL